MLEHIPNNSMYTTIPPSVDYWCDGIAYDDYMDTVDFLIEHNRSFIEDEADSLEE